MTFIPIVISALGTVTKGLIKGLEDFEIRGQVETIQTPALLRSARTLGRVHETWEDWLSLKVHWKTISVSWCEKLPNNNNNNNRKKNKKKKITALPKSIWILWRDLKNQRELVWKLSKNKIITIENKSRREKSCTDTSNDKLRKLQVIHPGLCNSGTK